MQINGIRSILRQSTRNSSDNLILLASSIHERTQTNFSKTKHTCYLVHAENFKDWNPEYAPVPPNFILLDRKLGINQIPKDIVFDLILSENRFGQYGFFKRLSRVLHLPMIQYEHTDIYDVWSPAMLQQIRTLEGDFNGFITEYSRDRWGWNKNNAFVIGHMIETDVFCPDDNAKKDNVIGSVVNDWINRDYPCGHKLWQRVTSGMPVRPVGATPGLSEAAKSIDDLVNHYRKFQVFINTSQLSPIPMSLLEAASCECAIVTTKNCAIPEYFTDELNCFMTNDETIMKKRLKQLLGDKKLCKEMGRNARKMVLEKCGEEQYINKWNEILYKASNKAYLG